MKKISVLFLLLLNSACFGQAVINPPICYGEPIALFCTFFSGGCSQPYGTYHWTNASGSWQSNEENPVVYPDMTGYNSDKFYLQVQYPQPPGSFSGGRVTVVVFSRITATPVITPVTCYGGINGAITLTVTGGSPAYTYLWNDGVTTKNRTGLTSGNYTITVTDQRGCQNVSKGFNNCIYYSTPGTTYSMSQPSSFSVTPTITLPQCSSDCIGSITLSTSGGTSPYTYLWNNGSTSSSLSNLCNGSYTVTVTDNNGCKQYSYNNSIVSGFDVTTTSSNCRCGIPSSGAAYLFPSCLGNYSYIWSDGNTDRFRWGLDEGTYSVTVTGQSGHKVYKSVTIRK